MTLEMMNSSLKLGSVVALFTLAQTVALALPTVTIQSHETAIVAPRNSVYVVSQSSGTSGAVTYAWTKKSGPGNVTFNTPANRIANATFLDAATLPGLYVLQIKVTDSTGSTTQEVSIQVYPTGTNGGKLIAEAGSALNCWLNQPTVLLNGSYWGTTHTSEFNVTGAWTKVSGPGTVTFSGITDQLSQMRPIATFDATGTYVLQLTASDGTLIGTDKVVVQVYDDTAPGTIVHPQNHYNVNAAQFAYPASVTNAYTATPADFLNKYFKYDFNTQYDYAFIDNSRFSPPPALTDPHPHPRILFNYADLTDLRNRLATTAVGKQEMTAIKKMLTDTLTGASASSGPLYNALVTANGNLTTLGTTYDAQITSGTYEAVMYEAFRALIESDTTGGQNVAKALTTLAAHSQESMDTIDASTTQSTYGAYKFWQGGYDGAVGDHALALGYDFAYDFLDVSPNTGQRSALRTCLQRATNNEWSIGMDSLPGLDANRTNWAFNEGSYLLFSACAVEGETGTDPNLLPRLEAAYDRIFNLGVSADGAYDEGMGKGTISAEALVALAKRGHMLIASANAKNHIRQLYLNSLETDGNAFTWDELNGKNYAGSRFADVAALKYAFPTDPVIDFVYLNDLGPKTDTQSDGTLGYFGTTYNHEGFKLVNLNNLQAWDNLWRAIFATDPTATDWNTAAAQVATQVPNTYFSNNRGLLITRTGRDMNALRLYFQPRSEPGGHTEPDRNAFFLSALGRVWAPMYVNEGTGFDPAAAFSTLRIDNQGVSTIPADVIDFDDQPNFTYATGDAKNSYSKKSASSTTGTALTYTFNQTRLTPGKEPWADLPWGILPDWWTSIYGPASFQKDNYFWTDFNPVQRAFRTAGLVRGNTPYALIVDDAQKDNANHTYTWRMMLDDGAKVQGQTQSNPVQYSAGTLSTDAILFPATSAAPTIPTDNKRLLVRVLGASATPTFAITNVPWYGGGNKRALDITITAVSPDFKILLMPYLNGTALPTTSWSGNVMTLTAGTQVDQLTFTPQSDGHNKVSFSRVSQ